MKLLGKVLVGLLGSVAFLLLLAESDSLAWLVGTKLVGAALAILCCHIFNRINPEEEQA